MARAIDFPVRRILRFLPERLPGGVVISISAVSPFSPDFHLFLVKLILGRYAITSGSDEGAGLAQV